MSGAVEAVVDVGLGDIVGEAFDVASIVTDIGTEFISADSLGVAGLAFGVPDADVFSLGGFDVVGSLAGDAAWFDAFNPGAILDSIPSVGDFSLGSITDSLPSLSSITSSIPSVSDFQGYLKDIQTGLSKVAPYVQQVQNIAGYAGIQLPGTQILNTAAGAVNLASAGLNTAAGISSTVGKVVKTAESVAGGESIVTSIKGLVGGAAPVQAATGINILNDQQTAQLTKNASLINFFNDPGVQSPQNFNTAQQTIDSLTPVVADLQIQVDGANLAINQENENIAFYQNQLDNPDLTEEERAVIEANIQNSYDNIALAQQTIDNTEPLIISTSDQISQAAQLIGSTDVTATRSAAAVPGQIADRFSVVKGSNGLYSIINKFTGDTVQTGLDAQQAVQQARDLFISTPGISVTPSAVSVNSVAAALGITIPNLTGTGISLTTDPGDIAGTNVSNLVRQARDQQALREGRQSSAQSSDWRVRLRLAPNSTYLYNAPAYPGNPSSGPGLMAPLKETDGVIFPYTPAIDTAYKANYETYDLTHSNYRGYFYKNSYVDVINLRAQFTAQDTTEANYLLAVIHFFRSATKMFYGKDTQAGAPPPLVYLSGYGGFQFNEHPCVISQFNYQLPPDVDYIRAQSSLFVNTNMVGNRIRNPIANNPLSYITNRLLNSNLLPGALDFRPSQGNLPVTDPTYVPTKMEISISLLPIQSRAQVSNNFSVQEFANGNLLKGGYW